MDISALKNQAAGLARGGIWFGAGWIVGKGILDGDTAVAIVGGVLTLAGSGWTAWANTNSSIAQAFSAQPTTKRVETSDPKIAEAMKQADPETVVKIVPPNKEGI